MKTSDPVDVKIAHKGVQAKVDYGIAQTAQMMTVLSDSLYQRAKEAIIRELCTNAVDSHVCSGNDEMPVIKLPSYDNLDFYVRDYGTGMSEKQVREMYSVYGISDKTDSNELNGCLGIGSKSPFAYTTNFTTESFYNGTHSVYVNVKNSDGKPSLLKTGEAPTDEPNGLKVGFKCERQHIHEFQQAARKVLRWFDKPMRYADGTTATLYSFKENVPKGDGWIVERRWGEESRVVMGNVSYPITDAVLAPLAKILEMKKDWDKKQLAIKAKVEAKNDKKDDWYEGITNEQKVTYEVKEFDISKLNSRCKYMANYEKIIESNLTIFADIGDIDFVASREAIKCNKKTTDFIYGKLDKIIDERQAELKKDLKDCKTLWDAKTIFAKYKRQPLAECLPSVDFNGETISNEKITVDSKELKADVYELYRNAGNQNYFTRTKNHTYYEANFFPNQISNVYLVDDKDRYVSRLKKKYEDGFNEDITLIVPKDIPDNQADKDKLYNKIVKLLKMDKSKLHKISSLTMPERGRYNSGSRTNANASFVYKDKYWSFIGKDTIDMDAGGLYMEMYRNAPRRKGHECRQFNQWYSDAINAGISMPPIYGIKTKHIKAFKKHDKWINAVDFITEQIKMFNKQWLQAYIDYKEIRDKQSGLFNTLEKLVRSKSGTFMDENHIIKQFVNNYKTLENKYEKSRHKVSSFSSLQSDLLKDDQRIKLPKPKVKHMIKDYRKLQSKYIVLTEMPVHSPDSRTAQLSLQLIKKLDKQEK